MNYTFNQLRIFLKITELESITKAAKALHLTQPAVSIQLRNFQDQFEISLTEVIGRRLFVTDFGKEIAVSAENILNQAQEMDFKAMAHKGKLVGRLKISVVSTGKYVMPYFLKDFLKDKEGVELSLDVTNKSKVVLSLEKNEVDFSMVSVLPDNMKIDTVKLMQNKLFLISNTEKLFKNKIYDKSIFEKLPLIYREPGSGTRFVMEKFIERNNIPVQKMMELTSNEAVKQAVIAGLGCSIMPIIGIKNELQNGQLQIIPVKGFPIESTWHLIWLKEKKHGPVAKSFLKYIKEKKEKVIKNQFSWFEDY